MTTIKEILSNMSDASVGIICGEVTLDGENEKRLVDLASMGKEALKEAAPGSVWVAFDNSLKYTPLAGAVKWPAAAGSPQINQSRSTRTGARRDTTWT